MEIILQAAIGLLAGFLGGLLGVGGSTIIIPGLIIYLQYFGAGYRGQSQHLLQATAMICNVFIAVSAVVVHHKARAILKPVVLRLVLSALTGIIVGVTVSNSSPFARENGRYLTMILAGFFLYVTIYNVMRIFSKVDLAVQFDKTRKIPVWKIVLVGFPMGFLAGLLGIGGGTLCVPAQQLFLRIPLRNAIANSAVTIVFSALAGSIYKNSTLSLHGFYIMDSLQMAAMIIPAAIIGSWLGGKLTHRFSRRNLRISFIMFMILVSYMTFRCIPHGYENSGQGQM